MDVIAAYRAGIENAVASMGTALTPEHVQHLSHFTKKVILTYDGDKAGLEATAKALVSCRIWSWRSSVSLIRWIPMSTSKRPPQKI